MWIQCVTALILLAALQAGPPAEPGRRHGGAARVRAEAAAPGRPPWGVTYHDGSGNGFRFWEEAGGEGARFEYAPVRPEDSSAGTYSGGEPKSGRLTGRHARALWRWVRRLEADASVRAETRMKGTGAFSLTEPGGGTRDFIVKNSAPLSRFEEFLAQFRGRARRKRAATR